MASALEVAQNFADSVGFPRPSTLVTNTSDDIRQLTALINAAGRQLASRHRWQAMNLEASFTTVATESQGTIASIIGASTPGQSFKAILDDTIWNRTQRVPVCGPLSARIWQANKALSLTGPYSQFRIRQNQIIFNPAPTAGHTCYFEYASKSWCTDSTSSTYRTALAADNDLFLIPDHLFTASLEWRWLKKKGLEYAEEFQEYEYLVKDAIRDDKPLPTLRMDTGPQKYSAGVVIPIGPWPGL